MASVLFSPKRKKLLEGIITSLDDTAWNTRTDCKKRKKNWKEDCASQTKIPYV
jgi:hypothetical protein